MYRLGNYQQALAKIESDDGKRTTDLHFVRQGGRVEVRRGRDGVPVVGFKLNDAGRVVVGTWTAAGHWLILATVPLEDPKAREPEACPFPAGCSAGPGPHRHPLVDNG